MYQDGPPRDPREGHMVAALLAFAGRRLFNAYRKLHPALATGDLATEFDSDLGLAIAELKHRRPAVWNRMLDAPFASTFEEAEVIGFIGLTMKNRALSALRKERSIRNYQDYISNRADLEQAAQTPAGNVKEDIEEFAQALQAEGFDPRIVLRVFSYQAQGYTRQEISDRLDLSVRQIGRLITRTRSMAAEFQSRRK